MANTLSDGSTTITLPDDIRWIDRDQSWSVTQQREVTLGGAIIVEESKQLAGREITLQSGGTNSPTYAVITRDVLDDLLEMANDVRDDPLTLVLDYDDSPVTLSVRFRYPNAVKGEPVKFIVPTESSDYYSVTLQFIEV